MVPLEFRGAADDCAAGFSTGGGSGAQIESGHGGQTLGHGRAPGRFRGHHQHGVVTGDRPDHPGEAAAVEGRAYDMGRTRRGPQHDQVARVVGLHHPFAEHPPQVVLGCDLVGGQLGEGVGGLATGQADLDRAQLLQVAGDGGLGGLDALGGQQVDQMGLAAHRPGLQQFGDPVLSLVLGHRDPVLVPASTPRHPCQADPAWRACGWWPVAR